MKLFHRFKKLPYAINYIYDKLVSSIAFLPSLMALCFLVFTGFMMYLEHQGLTPWMEERIPSFLLIKSWDIASSILTTLIGALISLMVFSFSMVMVLLNNAAANYSPRILPGLVADRFHQFVLGTYLGTIIYCIILVINMTPTQDKIPLPGFSVLLGIFLGINCLMLFVLFIHSISESVQVDKILEKLNIATQEKMKKIKTKSRIEEAPPYHYLYWKKYTTDRSGHISRIEIDGLQKIGIQEDIRIKVLVPESRFILEGSSLFAVDRPIDQKVVDKILGKFVISTSNRSTSDYVTGFKYITEITVKAMSPGINDPGTAISAIDYLTILFSKKMNLSEYGAMQPPLETDTALPTRLWLSIISFDELLTFVLAPIRQYAKHDLMVTLKILEMLEFLYTRDVCKQNQMKSIRRETEIIKHDAKKHLTNPADFNKVLTYSKRILNNRNTNLINQQN